LSLLPSLKKNGCAVPDHTANSATQWRIVKSLSGADLTDLFAKPPAKGPLDISNSLGLNHRNEKQGSQWEVNFQECQPNALGPFGTLDGTLERQTS
jgi:hypothetical protein